MASRKRGSQVGSQVTKNSRANLEKSLQQQVYAMEIHNIQAERLRKTFQRMCGSQKDKFDKKDVIRILTELSFPFNKPEIDQWIWEIDEDLDGCINEYQFTLMYKRSIFDKTGLQPRNLFNLTQFLMYDLGMRGKITVEDTLELIYVRHPEQLQQNINFIFEENEKTEDGQDREMMFEEYLKQLRKHDLELRKRLEQQRRTVKIPKKQEDQD